MLKLHVLPTKVFRETGHGLRVCLIAATGLLASQISLHFAASERPNGPLVSIDTDVRRSESMQTPDNFPSVVASGQADALPVV